MEYRQLGRSGLRVSKLCLGMMRVKDEKEVVRALYEAIELGVNFIDTADCYERSEEVVGKALSEGGRRDRVVVATKAGWYVGDGPNDYGTSRSHLIRACENSLRKLRTDYIDLYILHVVDPNTPLHETLRTLDMLVRQGKVRYIGTSKWPAVRIVEALGVSEREGLERFVSEQPPYNLLDRRAENDLVWTCLHHGIGMTPFFPLGMGILSGKYRVGKAAPAGSIFADAKPGDSGWFSNWFTEAAVETADKFRPLAEAKGVTLAELSLAWLMNQPGVTAPCVGARTVDYLHSALKACQVEFSPEELSKIDEIVPPGGHVSNYYEGSVYRPMRMAYSSGARKLPGTGAYIPDHKTGSSEDAGRCA